MNQILFINHSQIPERGIYTRINNVKLLLALSICIKLMALISCVIITQPISAFAYANAKGRVSHDTVIIMALMEENVYV